MIILLCGTYEIRKKMADNRFFSPPGVVAMGNALSSRISRPNLFKKAPFKNMHCHIIYVRRKMHIWLNHVNSVAIELVETNVSSYLKLCPNCLSNTNVFTTFLKR